jgi:hypothetical protein
VGVVLLEAADELGGLLAAVGSRASTSISAPSRSRRAPMPWRDSSPMPGCRSISSAAPGAALVLADASGVGGVTRARCRAGPSSASRRSARRRRRRDHRRGGRRTRRAERDAPRGPTPEPSLFDLVAERLGAVVADRLVDTLCRSVYSRAARARGSPSCTRDSGPPSARRT